MVLALCASLVASVGDFSPPPLVEADVPPLIVEEAPPRWSLMIDGGLPSGAGASLALRPARWVRIHAGALYNGVSPGFRAGVTLVAFHFPLTPTLTVEGGHLLDGDANGVAASLHLDGLQTPALRHFGYDFGSALVGVELGPPDRWTLCLRVGVSYVRGSAALEEGVRAGLALVGLNAGTNGVWIPSASVGMNLFLL